MSALAAILWHNEDYSSALEMYERLLAVILSSLGEHHPLALVCIDRVNRCLWELEHLHEATAMLRKGLKAREEAHGEAAENTLETMK